MDFKGENADNRQYPQRLSTVSHEGEPEGLHVYHRKDAGYNTQHVYGYGKEENDLTDLIFIKRWGNSRLISVITVIVSASLFLFRQIGNVINEKKSQQRFFPILLASTSTA